MELYFLDKQLNRLTFSIDRVYSVKWQLRFFECGSFRAVFPWDEELVRIVGRAEYLCAVNDGIVRCGRIEYVEITGEQMEIKGQMPESLLSDRVIEGLFFMPGTVTNVVLSAVSENCREIPVVIGEDSDVVDGAGIFFAKWEKLSSWVYRVLKPYGASYRVDFDADMGKFVFRVVRPVGESGAVFSASLGNIGDTVYRRDSASVKNKVYVEGADGEVVWMDISNGSAKREFYRKAADLSGEMFDEKSKYLEALRIRAAEALAEYGAGAELTCRVEDEQVTRFGRDYGLGDFCYAADESTGVHAKVQIVGADEVWEKGERRMMLLLRL